MIHVIDNHLRAGRQPLLRSMFADRKRLFVDLFGWDVPVVEDQYELDQFDTADAVYIVIAGRDGAHQASLRLLCQRRLDFRPVWRSKSRPLMVRRCDMQRTPIGALCISSALSWIRWW